MKLFEMEGFLRGKCIPGDLKVNETNAEYLVRKLNKINELTAAHSTLEKAREVTNCPDGVDLQDHLKQLVAENTALLSFISHSCYSYDGDGSDVCDSYVDAESSPWFPKTPPTVSILRAAEARGVENLRDIYHRLSKSCEAFGKVEDSVFHDAVVDACDQWLREGKA